MSEHRGGCHCGNLRLSLRLSQTPAETRLRACGCSFCRAHSTRTTSDPNGSVDIRAADWSLVERYRFGTGTAEFLICKRCGVYVGAIGDAAGGTRAVINTNCLDDRAAFTQTPHPVDHEARRPATAWPAAPPIGRRRRSARVEESSVLFNPFKRLASGALARFYSLGNLGETR